MIQKGTKGNDVIALQQQLNAKGAKLVCDGDFGAVTESALKAYQKKNLSPETGVYDEETMACLNPLVLPCAKFYPLPRSEYKRTVTEKKGVCIHHTAGGPKAKNVVDVWAKDDRKNVATHFVVGADGEILQCIPLQCWSHQALMDRVGLHSMNTIINSQYIGIEICNWGYLELKDGVFYNYCDRVVPNDQVVKLDKPFCDHIYWHKYTDAQVVAVRLILAQLKEMYGFVYEDLPLDATWLNVDKKAQHGARVLLGHLNLEGYPNKADPSAQPAFFEMVKP